MSPPPLFIDLIHMPHRGSQSGSLPHDVPCVGRCAHTGWDWPRTGIWGTDEGRGEKHGGTFAVSPDQSPSQPHGFGLLSWPGPWTSGASIGPSLLPHISPPLFSITVYPAGLPLRIPLLSLSHMHTLSLGQSITCTHTISPLPLLVVALLCITCACTLCKTSKHVQENYVMVEYLLPD